MRLFVDGSNVLMNLRLNGLPSVAVLLFAIKTLESRGYLVATIFDQSIQHLLARVGAASEWAQLQKATEQSKGAITFVVNADSSLLAAARESNGAVVNHSDRYRDWKERFGELPPLIRVGLTSDMLTFLFEDNKVTPFAVSLPQTLIRSDVGEAEPPNASKVTKRETTTKGVGGMSERLLKSNNRRDETLRARLVIFALDASGSMFNMEHGGYETYDGMSKGSHVLRELRSAVHRMCASKVSNSFFCSVIAFAGSADVCTIKNHKMVHVTHLRDELGEPDFSYENVVTDTRGTNLAGALQHGRALIDSVLADPENQKIASAWSATIILLTDGRSDEPEEVKKIAATLEGGRLGSVNLQKIDLACVGIGKDVDFDLLTNIASPVSDTAGKLLRNNQLHEQLPRTNAGSRLMAIRVDMNNKNYADAVRSFVDIASSVTS